MIRRSSTIVVIQLVFAPLLSGTAGQFKFPGQTITVPDGFEIEIAAGTNLVQRPMSIDYDEQGRLYVTDSSGSNDKVTDQLEKKPHRVLRLEDVDGDGRFDRSTTFADKLMFPEGAMWLDGSLYVSAAPSIWKLTDTKGDGVAEGLAWCCSWIMWPGCRRFTRFFLALPLKAQVCAQTTLLPR